MPGPEGQRSPLFRLRAVVVALLFGLATAHADSRRITVDGTMFSVTGLDGRVLKGADVAGASLIADINGIRTRILIASVTQDPANPEVWLHDLRVTGPDGIARPICAPGPDGIAAGFPVLGHANPDATISDSNDGHFELICTGGAEGKCVRFGYRPDKTTQDGRAMRDYYNACVHLVRADYCGDGSGTTRNGMPIDIYDHIGVERRSTGEGFAASAFRFEAAFGPHGAVCVAHTRVPENMTLEGLANACPRLADRLGPERCSEDMAVDALLFVRSK